MNDKSPAKTNAPLYANLFVAMVPIARAHGYALSVHGSMARDFDVVAVPWATEVRPAAELVAAFTSAFYFVGVDGPAVMPHGRLCWTLAWPGSCFVDLSVMAANPRSEAEYRSLLDRLTSVSERLVFARRAIVALRGHRNQGTSMN